MRRKFQKKWKLTFCAGQRLFENRAVYEICEKYFRAGQAT